MISGETLRAARELLNKTQQDVADILHVHVNTVAGWEKPGGKVPPKRESVVEALFGPAVLAKARAFVSEEQERVRHMADDLSISVTEALGLVRLTPEEVGRDRDILVALTDLLGEYRHSLGVSGERGDNFRRTVLEHFPTAELLAEVQRRLSGELEHGIAPADFTDHKGKRDEVFALRDGRSELLDFEEFKYAADDRQTAPDEDEHQP